MLPQPAWHRKRVKHLDLPGHVHELTFSCFHRRPLLTTDARCEALSAGINAAIARHKFSLLGFVFMPEHVHLLVFPEHADSRVDRLLYAIKRPVSARIKLALKQSPNPADVRLLEELTIQERPGKTAFRFWQEGPGYDRNLISPESVREALDYIHTNPMRRGLVGRAADWKWSSWHAYSGDLSGESASLPSVHSTRLSALLRGA